MNLVCLLSRRNTIAIPEVLSRRSPGVTAQTAQTAHTTRRWYGADGKFCKIEARVIVSRGRPR